MPLQSPHFPRPETIRDFKNGPLDTEKQKMKKKMEAMNHTTKTDVTFGKSEIRMKKIKVDQDSRAPEKDEILAKAKSNIYDYQPPIQSLAT